MENNKKEERGERRRDRQNALCPLRETRSRPPNVKRSFISGRGQRQHNGIAKERRRLVGGGVGKKGGRGTR